MSNACEIRCSLPLVGALLPAISFAIPLIVCVPDERLQSLIRNVDCVYGFRRHQNQISMMHIDMGDYLKLMEGEHGQGEPETVK